jgi:prepilin-type N-terminal cleavage/methylation domain-containing protein
MIVLGQEACAMLVRTDRTERHRRPDAGFTLTEIMVVLVIFGIMTAIALPGFNRFMRSLDMNNHVQVIAPTLRVMLQRAITENYTYRCWYDAGARSFGWWDDDNSDFIYVFGEQWGPADNLPAWITVSNSVSNPMTQFWTTFNPDGTASQSFTLVFSNSDGYSRTVSVIRPTGMITVQ